MLLLTYQGVWVDTSLRHPEPFTILAPKNLQEACAWNPAWPFGLWDTTFYGYPKFRLTLLDSRFVIAGGQEVTFLDNHGNWKTSHPAEVLYPRYQVGPEYSGRYVLEMWRPAAWYYEHGFANPARAIDYSPAGVGVRKIEPVWVEGGWEAIMNGLESPLTFGRDSSQEGIKTAIWLVHLLFKQQLEPQPKPMNREQF